MTIVGPLSSVSVVVVAVDECPSLTVLETFADRLGTFFQDIEFVIVGNDLAPPASVQLKALSEELPDSLVLFLGERVHEDLARLIGIDHAVSDYVLFATPTINEAQSIHLLEHPLRAGADVVIGRSATTRKRGLFERLLFSIFQRLFRWTTRIVFEDEPPPFRMLSRAAALYVATRKEGEVLIRASAIGSGFPSAEIALLDYSAPRPRKSSALESVARGARFITTGSTMLLRLSSYLALSAGVASALYGVYVVFVYMLVPDVEPGWTTLSLQLAGMLLVFSIQFLLLSEHVLQMSGTGGIGNRRHYIIRELRGPLSRRSRRLNIVDEEGRFQLGAPSTHK